jgi:hypothetical protein
MSSAFRPAGPAGTSWRGRTAAIALLAVAAVLLVVLAATAFTGGGDDGAGSSGDGASAKGAPGKPAPPPELPTGGRRIFPDYRVVGFYGNPAADELGILGIGSPSARASQLRKQAKPYARASRPVLPAFELISTIANRDPGDNGRYNTRVSDKVISRYYKAARKAKALLVLDIQPGRADFFEETIRLRKWLVKPDVGLALDPEWRMQAGQIPGTVIGSVSSREINATTAWLDQLTQAKNLPQKLVVIHQFTQDMITQRERLKQRKTLGIVLNADGFGNQANKLSKYHAFTRGPKTFLRGYKLFFKEDTDLMTPREVMRMKPRPDFVVYE